MGADTMYPQARMLVYLHTHFIIQRNTGLSLTSFGQSAGLMVHLQNRDLLSHHLELVALGVLGNILRTRRWELFWRDYYGCTKCGSSLTAKGPKGKQMLFGDLHGAEIMWENFRCMTCLQVRTMGRLYNFERDNMDRSRFNGVFKFRLNMSDTLNDF